MGKKPYKEWVRFNIPAGSTSTWFAINRAKIPKPSYVVIFGAILFETEELKQRFEDAYYHRELTHGPSN